MFKWFRSSSADNRESDPVTDDIERRRIEDGEWIENSIETLAFVLRTYGHGGFDTETRSLADLAAECDGWSQHLMSGGGPSDWRGIRRFFRGARDEEHAFVDGFRDETRAMVTDIVSGLRTALEADAASDAQVAESMDGLKAAVDAGDLQQLRRRAGQAVTAVQSAIQDRAERHRAEMERLARQIARMQGELTAVKLTAQTDGLTQVYNRASLDAFVEALVKKPPTTPTTLLMVDVDLFKKVNDIYGHRTGDQVLRAVSDALSNACRKGSSFVSRYGGDEFAVVLQNAPVEGAQGVAQRFLDAAAAIEIPTAPDITVSLSIGIAELNEGDSVESWTHRADKALYKAKRDGRGRYAALPAHRSPATDLH